MKFNFLFFFLSGITLAQINPEKEPFPPEDFVVYLSKNDSIQNVLYEIGRYEPKGYTFTTGHNGAWIKVPLNDEQKNNKNFFHTHAPIYLKITKGNTGKYYFLDDYYDIDMYSFSELKSENLIFITARYSMYIIDNKHNTLSSKIIPGDGQYEGEDAISPLYSALTLFDEENFLLGNVQGFGVFCIDITHPAKPKELKQYSIDFSNKGQYYAFFHRKKKNKFDIMIAQSDVETDKRTIRRLYKKLKTVRYVMKSIPVKTNSSGEPQIEIGKHNLHFISKEKHYQLDLEKGILLLSEE